MGIWGMGNGCCVWGRGEAVARGGGSGGREIGFYDNDLMVMMIMIR